MLNDLYSEPTPVERQQVKGGSWSSTGRSLPVSMSISRGSVRGPELSWNYFHPGRVDARFAPDAFRRRLHEVDERLEVVWHPIHERWVCFVRQPDIKFWMCPGWKRLFIVRYPDESFMPLDERTLGEAWSRHPKLYNYRGRDYFERVVLEHMREQRRTERKDYESDLEARARDQWRYAQIKNIGSGSKFADHEAAD